MVETRIRPQNLNLKIPESQLKPSAPGTLWVDSSNILRVDSVGSGEPSDFIAVIPQHTADGKHGPKVTINQTAADNALSIVKGGASSSVSIVCTTTDAGHAIDIASISNVASVINIEQNGDGSAMTIVRSGTGSQAEVLVVSQSGTGGAVKIEKSDTGAGSVLQISNSGTGAGVKIESAASGIGLQVSQSGNANAMQISKSDTGSSSAVEIHSSASSGAMYISQSGTNPGSAIRIIQGAVGNADAIALDVHTNARHGIRINSNSSTGNCINIVNSSSTGNCINIINSSSTGGCLNINNHSDGNCINITNTGNGRSINIEQVGSGPVLTVSKSAFDFDGAIVVTNHSGYGCGIKVAIPNDGQDGIVIDKTNTTPDGLASGSCLRINNSSGAVPIIVRQANTGTATAINIINSGSGYDIKGNNGNWWIDSEGNASFANVSTKIVSGTATVSSGNIFSVDFVNGLVSPSGTFIGSKGQFTAAPHIIISNSNTGLQDRNDNHRLSWTYAVSSTKLNVTLSVTKQYHPFSFMWLAIGN